MNITLLKALIALAPACLLFSGSAILFIRSKGLGSFLQLLGTGCLVLVVLTHILEALHLFPWMNWGRESSFGHYLDLGSAVLGVTLFPVGYLLYALTRQHGWHQPHAKRRW
jgi:succinate dehydrogenase/fumarate reductase cytochrome b subunit